MLNKFITSQVIKDQRMVEPLLRGLSDKKLDKDNREDAVKYLCSLESPASLDFLCEELKSPLFRAGDGARFRKFYIGMNYLLFMEQQNIDTRLDRIEKTLKYIQENMIDIDVIITEEERRMLDDSVENEKSGNLVSLEEIKNVRNKAR